jgi:membrane-associated phospholipid phosphatase
MRYARTTIVALAPLLIVASTAAAQSVGQMLDRHARASAGDAWAVWTSPFHAGPRDFTLAAAALAISAAVSPLDDDADRWMVRHRDSPSWSAVTALREGGAAFSGRTITPIAIGAFAVGLATNNDRLQEALFGCLTAYGASSGVRTYVAYPLFARQRPDTGRGGVPMPPAAQGDQYRITFPGSSDWGLHSAPGGHITNVAACASFLSHRFHLGPGVSPVLYALAAGVGVGRLVDRRHWLSDTVLGLFFGYAVGKEIALRSGRRANAGR